MSRTGQKTHRARWWHQLADGRIECDLCPRHCRLRAGQRGFCFVREHLDGNLVLTAYGRCSGLCLDPVEKKPLYHVRPGSSVLSFGTAGCNLACKYCQNWHISTANRYEALSTEASPGEVARLAKRIGADGVAFTYNDPVVFAEYAIDTAEACHRHGVKAYAVTAGWICARPGREFFAAVDAANVDLKGFSDDFYRKITGARLADVQATLVNIREHCDTWLELTTLVIPGLNDSVAEIGQLASWVARELGPHTPLHLSAFHPSHRMLDRPRTPLATLQAARKAALDAGLCFVYLGNVTEPEGSVTYCPGCAQQVIVRRGYQVTSYRLDEDGCCLVCHTRLAGIFGALPGSAPALPQRIRF